MLIQKQKNLHQPELGIYGDCFRTCLAVLLDVDALMVPHFLHNYDNRTPEEIDRSIAGWLEYQNLNLIRIQFPGEETQENIMLSANMMGSGLPYLLSGLSRTGCNHVVVCQGTEIVCDPSLTDAGIIGPMKENYWWVEWLVGKPVFEVPEGPKIKRWI